MSSKATWLRVFILFALTFPLSIADARAADEIERLRAEPTLLRTTMQAAFDRSPTFRALVGHIEQSDVIVHLTCGHFSGDQDGSTALAAVGWSARYLRVRIHCGLPAVSLAAVIGHELRHVVEIASSATVVDVPSLVRLFSRIGFHNCLSATGEQFETRAAIEVGDRVYSELTRSGLGVVNASAAWRELRTHTIAVQAGVPTIAGSSGENEPVLVLAE